MRRSWHVLEPATELEWNWHHDAVCQHIQALLEDWMRAQEDAEFVQRMQNLLMNVPPGTMKSRIVSVCTPAWMWTRWPSWRAIFLSSNPRVSLRDSVYCRDLITSRWYQDLFSPDWELKDDQDAKGLYANTRGGFRQAMGFGARITGDRADALFVDDPHDAEEVQSRALREAVLERWDSAIANRVNDPRRSVRCGIMQRLHEVDWSGHILKQGDWEHLRLPMEFEVTADDGKPACACETCARGETVIGWRDPRRTLGEVLHPRRFTPRVLASELRRLGSSGYAGQMQQRPSPEGGAIFQRGWFRRWTRGTLPAVLEELFFSWDFTFKETASSDYVVGGVFARNQADVYLLERVRGRMDLVRTVAELEALRTGAMARWGSRLPPGYVPRVVYEDKANGPAVKSTLRSKIPGLVPFDPGDRSKEARAYAVSPYIEGGNYWVPDDAPWVDEYLHELESFPNGANDDQVDMTTQALLQVSRGGTSPPEREEEPQDEGRISRWVSPAGTVDM